MPRFILIDHSLKGIGGHHYDYAMHVVEAADRLGYETVVAAHRRFRPGRDFPPACRVYPLFRYHTYSKYTIFSGEKFRLIDPGSGDDKPTPAKPKCLHRKVSRLVARLKEFRHRGGPRRRIDDVTSSCRRLFTAEPLADGDHVFVPTLSELDLAALAEYWNSDESTRAAAWHLQFHFNIFDGREPDYDRQLPRLEALREHLAKTLASVPNHELHFYNTTEQLAEQYNRLGLAEFKPLTYPVSPALLGATRSNDVQAVPGESRPLRVVCAGGNRHEKNFEQLADVAADLWQDMLAKGDAQLAVQSRTYPLSSRPKFTVPLPPGEAVREQCVQRLNDDNGSPLVYLPFPLAIEDYTALLQDADIGLFLYDSDRYYVRRAGIMGEMLSVGVPVIVPAGCWLAEQIAESNFEQHSALREQLAHIERIDAATLKWQAPRGASSCVTFGRGELATAAEFYVPESADEMVFQFRRAAAVGRGTYIQISATQLDAAGEAVTSAVEIVGRRLTGEPATIMFRLLPSAAKVRLTLANAYHDAEIALDEAQIEFLSAAEQQEAGPPHGRVGLIAASIDEVPRLLREMVAHYKHYRASAVEFSQDWQQRHSPERTIAELVGAAAPTVMAWAA